MRTRVFLSGAIEGVGEYAYPWRYKACEMLNRRGFEAINPMDYALEETDCEPKEIVSKNIFLQNKCDLILVEYLLADRPYIGTDFEMTWAYLHNQPVIAFAAPSVQSRVYMKFLSTKVVSTLEEAIEYIAVTYPNNK
jgi:nucleoside 2-deoxyribosyltransferase